VTPPDQGGSSSADTVAFTGEILPVFYVRDVLRSADFYSRQLGFQLNHFHDYDSGESVSTWGKPNPPVYAELEAAGQKFAIHRASTPESLSVSGTSHYFGVGDVDHHCRFVRRNGVETGEFLDRPWMRMFSVLDPDGHRIFFFTRPEPED
jgi:catechol 2,3-dioxygenase-like lactoylglutathione lyase family enzyme